MSMKQQTIAEIASGSGSFDILVKALALTAQNGSSLLAAAADPHADLTVFAPTDEAFFSLAREFGYEGHDEQEAFDALVEGLTELTGSPEAAVQTLDNVLAYHVSGGEKSFRDIRNEGDVETLLVIDGEPQSFHVAGRQLIDVDKGLENPRVVQKNVDASNGVIQVIDEVLIPIDLSGLIAAANKPQETIAEIAAANGDFDILVKALALTADEGGSILLSAASDASADLTVFAPTDAAFLALSREFGYEGHDEQEAFDAIVQGLTELTGSPEAAVKTLGDVLAYHVSAGEKSFRDIRSEGEVETLLEIDGAPVSFEVNGRRLIDEDDGLKNPKVVARDIDAANGTIQVIDQVLIPIDLSGLIEDATLPTIAEIAATNGDFDILVKALALTGEAGSPLLNAAADPTAALTVFAPTDAAFINLAREFGYEGHDEQDAFDALVQGLTDLTGSPEAAIATLGDVLAYHVSAGEQSFREIRKEGEVTTLLEIDGVAQSFQVSGRSLIDADDGLANPRITGRDVEASNGKIQVIDNVLIPLELSELIDDATVPTIAEIAQDAGDFDILVKALALTAEEGGSGLLAAASDPTAELTVFAPTDAAFIALAREFGYEGDDEARAFEVLVDGLTEITGSPEAAIKTLGDVLAYHVSAGEQSSREIRAEGDVTTLLEIDGEAQSFHVSGRSLIDADDALENPRITGRDVDASNGVIQVIDQVLIPIDLSGLIDAARSDDTIAEIAAVNGDFDLLVKALALTAEAGDPLLAAASDPEADLTVFAPTDAAFIALAREFGFQGEDEDAAFEALVGGLVDLTGSTEAAVATLGDVLAYHVSAGEKSFRDIRSDRDVETLLEIDGQAQSFHVAGSKLIDADKGLPDPKIVGRDVEASNGKIQVIDQVLIPIDLSGLLEAAGGAEEDASGAMIAAFQLDQGDVAPMDPAIDPMASEAATVADGEPVVGPEAELSELDGAAA
ncbi:MAG: fasciclin domain-containing protein [Pseudomonadota bacterium]